MSETSQRTEVLTDKAPAPVGPYSQAIAARGGLVFTAGQIAIDPATGAVMQDADVGTQTERVLQNLQAVLTAAGTSLARAIKTTVFLSDMNDFTAMNEVYRRFFADPAPARSCVEVARLPKDVLVEIDVVALTSE
ncbi:MAG: RidA family protein [Cyanobacteria bacterium P01_D01_bin.123]